MIETAEQFSAPAEAARDFYDGFPHPPPVDDLDNY
jgi:hypothetical protein